MRADVTYLRRSPIDAKQTSDARQNHYTCAKVCAFKGQLANHAQPSWHGRQACRKAAVKCRASAHTTSHLKTSPTTSARTRPRGLLSLLRSTTMHPPAHPGASANDRWWCPQHSPWRHWVSQARTQKSHQWRHNTSHPAIPDVDHRASNRSRHTYVRFFVGYIRNITVNYRAAKPKPPPHCTSPPFLSRQPKNPNRRCPPGPTWSYRGAPARAVPKPLAASHHRKLPAHVNEDCVQLGRLSGDITLASEWELQ